MSLQTTYRPNSFKLFAGNDALKASIENILKREDPPSSFMIVGPSGCGKTTLGRIIAKNLGCSKGDFKELNTASDRTLPAIRAILEDMKYAPLEGKKKVVLFDEAHQLLTASQEALLKALEEPPEHVHFIVCTTNPEALKDTFKRRCHIYEVELLTSSQLINHMKKILSAEKVKDFPIAILDKIVELSGGSPGIALKYLDMVIDMADDVEQALLSLKSAGTSESEVIDICRTLVNFRMSDASKWRRVKKLISEYKGDGESARRPILGYLKKCLLGENASFEIALVMDEFKDNFYDSGTAGLVLACFKACHISED